MNREDLQREMLLSQFQKKRSLRQKYLREERERTGGPLLERMMKNVLLLSIRERADIFGLLLRLEQMTQPDDGMPLDWTMDLLTEVCELLGCGAYELFVEEREKQSRIIRGLLEDLSQCRSWEEVTADEKGNGSFLLPGADYVCRMSETPSANLIFRRSGNQYSLTMMSRRVSGVFPRKVLLWQEEQGPLQTFVDRTLKLEGGLSPEGKAQREAIRKETVVVAETLGDLAEILEALPEGSQLTGLLKKETEKLRSLMHREKELYMSLPPEARESAMGQGLREAAILLGGAAGEIEKLAASPQNRKDRLTEIVYMLKETEELM